MVDHFPDVTRGEHRRHGPAQVIRQWRRPHCFVVAPDRVSAAPRVLNLPQHVRTRLIDGGSDPLQLIKPLIVPAAQSRGQSAEARHGNRFGHDGSRATRSTGTVIVKQLLGRCAVCHVLGDNGRVDDPVSQRHATDINRAEQGWEEGIRRHGCDRFLRISLRLTSCQRGRQQRASPLNCPMNLSSTNYQHRRCVFCMLLSSSRSMT